jgi:DMSO/TMAO reductase YedYZ molybdopterin-dependent catalytic subunit
MDERKIVTASPENSETPLESVRSWVTPTRLFFVRNHFDVPQIDVESWRLRIDGRVARTSEWTWQQLADLPERTVLATVECAGNGRSYLQEKVRGVQWGSGAIGHGEWTGVPLHLVLERAGVLEDAVEILFEGADLGSEADHPAPMHFARSLPLDKAFHPDTLLATRMNGELLEPIHGFPLRLFVPGWYGVASVKWLNRITAIAEPFRGYYQYDHYTVKRKTATGTEKVMIGPMVVKSEIIRPRPDDVLGHGTNRVFGVAWAGPDAVARVEVTTDGCATWHDAELIGPRAPYSWTMWEYLWDVTSAGPHAIATRATSTRGATQPVGHDPLYGGYLIHHVRPISVVVEAARPSLAAHADEDTLAYDMNAFAEDNMRVRLDLDLAFGDGEGI